jgi:hypothetical protein
MIHSRRGSLRRISLLVALLSGVSASLGAISSPAFASTAATKTTKTTFTLYCKTGLADGDVSVATTQTYPASVAAGQKFTIKWSSITTVGGALAGAAYLVAPGGKEKGTVTTDNDLSTDATPKTLNIAGTKGVKESGTISSSSGFPIYTPVKGSLTTQSFTAGKKGTDEISAQDDDANLVIDNKSGKQVTSTTATCTPVGTPSVIATITVT